MAHADYNCCAICDRKMEYNGYDPSTKEKICLDCIEKTIALGHPITRPEQIKEHLDAMTDDAAVRWLRDVGFCCCFYQNEVDVYAKSRGFVCD